MSMSKSAHVECTCTWNARVCTPIGANSWWFVLRGCADKLAELDASLHASSKSDASYEWMHCKMRSQCASTALMKKRPRADRAKAVVEICRHFAQPRANSQNTAISWKKGPFTLFCLEQRKWSPKSEYFQSFLNCGIPWLFGASLIQENFY